MSFCPRSRFLRGYSDEKSIVIFFESWYNVKKYAMPVGLATLQEEFYHG